MTIVEKIMLSADKKYFTFFREGLFYKCYNEDMMVFVQHIKAYKVTSMVEVCDFDPIFKNPAKAGQVLKFVTTNTNEKCTNKWH